MQKRKSNRIKFFFLLALLIFVALTGTAAYAALTDKEQKVTVYQIGNLETAIKEVFDAPTDSIVPGKEYKKEVTIQNTGTIAQFVRVMILPEISRSSSGTVEQLYPSTAGKEVILDITDKEWVNGQDGYYYYLKKLDPKETTTELLKKVTLSDSLGTAYEKASFKLMIKVEAIHCGNKATNGTNSYQEAWWNGTVPKEDPLKKIDQALQNTFD